MLHAHEKRARLTVSARRCCPVVDDAFFRPYFEYLPDEKSQVGPSQLRS